MKIRQRELICSVRRETQKDRLTGGHNEANTRNFAKSPINM